MILKQPSIVSIDNFYNSVHFSTFWCDLTFSWRIYDVSRLFLSFFKTFSYFNYNMGLLQNIFNLLCHTVYQAKHWLFKVKQTKPQSKKKIYLNAPDILLLSISFTKNFHRLIHTKTQHRIRIGMILQNGPAFGNDS